MKKKIMFKDIVYFTLLLYFIAISAYQLGTGFDAIFVRISFLLLFILSLFYKKKLLITKQLIWVILFWGFYILSLLWASNKTDTLRYINNIFQIIGLSIIFPCIVEKKEDISIVLKLYVFSLLYTCVLLIVRSPMSLWGTERVGEVIGLNSNTLGVRLAIASIIIFYYLSNLKKNNIQNYKIIKKTSLILILILFIIITFFTGSKKGFFMTFIGIFLFEILSEKGFKLLIKMSLISCLLLFSIFLTFKIPQLYNVIGYRLERMYMTILYPNSKNLRDYSMIERRYYVEEAKKIIAEKPLLGSGGNNFVTHMREINYSHIAYSHNNYYELLSTLGIVGTLLYYYYWFYILYLLFKISLKKKDRQSILFLILIVVLLITDYWHVCYISEINNIFLILFSIHCIYYRKDNCYENKKEIINVFN